MPEEPARDATIDSKLQNFFRHRLPPPVAGTPSGVGSRLRVSARGRRFFTEDGLPGAGVVRLRHFNPVIDGRISKNPGELLAYRDFLHLQHFLLDTVSRHGQYVEVRTAYWSQEVNNGRQDSGEL